MEEALKIEEMKMEMKKKNEDKNMTVNRDNQFKLHKLEITKFEGTHLDWLQFCNHFKTETDKVEISAISKFCYLKEFLPPKVRAQIDGFLFIPERYVRAKYILLAKFGIASKVATAHIQCITSLPVIPNSHPNKIHKSCEKLIVSVYVVDTIHQLR